MSFPVRFGKFLLLERVNVGGMAEVFKAKSTGVAGFERILAIKRILPNLVEDDDFIRMFIDEARIAVQLNHANIVQIYELGKQGEHYYIAMEYIPSRDLRGILDRLRASGQLMPIAQAAYITAKVAEGLDYAHRRKDPQGNPMNIIHRDVSPQNILVGFEGEVKVIDFGIAKAANRASKTQAGVLKGKFGYMSPEQVRGLPIDRRSDIFAVGVLLYEMLTGERLFIGESDFSTLERVRNADVIAPTNFNKKISPQLEQIVLKTLAREVEDRYQWASELARDLQSFSSDATGAYNARRVSGTMREMYAPEVALEKKKLEEFMRIVAADIKDKSSLPQSVLPLPARHDIAANRDAVDDGDGDGEFGEDKTFVIEASAAGLALGAQPTDSNLANKQAAKDLSSDDVSLYGRGEGSDDDDDGDARTLVGAENPYFSSPGVPPVPLAKPEAPTRPMTPLERDNVPRAAPEMPRPSVASPPRPGRSFDAVAAAMAQEDQDALLAISGSAADVPRYPPVPFGVEPAGATREVTPSSSSSQPPPTPAQRPLATVPRHASDVVDDFAAPLPSMLPAPVPWVPVGIAAAASAALLVAAIAFVAVRATSEGTPAELGLSAVGTPPAGLVISLDGQEVGRTLPLTVALPDGSHSLEVVAAGAVVARRSVQGTGGTVRQPVLFLGTPEPVAPPSIPTSNPLASGPPPPVSGGWRLMLAAVGDDGIPVDGAEVFVNGRSLGLTPLEAELDPALDQLAIQVKKDGFTDHQVGVVRGGRAVIGPATVSLRRASVTAVTEAPLAAAQPPPESVATPAPVPAPAPAPAPAVPEVRLAANSQPTTNAAASAKTPTERPVPLEPATVSAPKKIAEIQLGTSPYAETTIDGRKYGMTPFFGPRTLSLPVGTHKVEFFDKVNNKKYRYTLKLKAVDPNNKVVIQFNKSDPPKVEGQVELRKE